MRPTMLLAYDADGRVIATLDYMVAAHDGEPRGLIDFAAYEDAGGALTEIWRVKEAAGSGTWPEWLGGRAREFRVELEPGWARASHSVPHRIRALVHAGSKPRLVPGGDAAVTGSGHRRERQEIEAAIEARIRAARGRPADIRDLVGGPDRPLRLDAAGALPLPRPAGRRVTLPTLPIQRDG